MKSQTLIFVMLVMIIAGIFGFLLADMWTGEGSIRSAQKESLTAFYLAQAALERGKITILHDVGNRNNLIKPSGYWPGPTASDWSTELDVPGDNYTFQYNFDVDNFNGPQITITGRGEVLDTNNNVLAYREITVVVNGISDLVDNSTGFFPPDGIDDNFNDNQQVTNTWQEL